MESPQGTQYQRDITHLKKYQTSANYPPNKPKGPGQPTECTTKVQEKGATPSPAPVKESLASFRPTRTRSAPKRFDDYVMT